MLESSDDNRCDGMWQLLRLASREWLVIPSGAAVTPNPLSIYTAHRW